METTDLIIKKEFFIKHRQQSFQKIYQVHPKILGQGTFGKVYKVRERSNGANWRAAKVYNKKKGQANKQMLNELAILRHLDYPSIIKIYETFEENDRIIIIQDFCGGGSVFERLVNKGALNEGQARIVFRQLVESINYCHYHHICHRDIKPENILFLSSEGFDVKLADFGHSFEWQKNMKDELSAKSSKNVIGSAYYISPDILQNNNSYDQRTDIWSLGVVLYTLVTASAPFDGDTEQQILQNISHFRYSLNEGQIKSASPALKDLIKKILVPPKMRLTCQQILQHPWMISQPSSSPVKIITSNIARFAKFSKTKKLTSNLIASQISSSEVQQLTKLFQQIDINKDGQISFQELKRCLEKQGMKYSQIKQFMDSMDSDRNGKINYTQFLAGFSGQQIFNEQSVRRAFQMLDRDGNGLVQKSELLDLFKQSEMSNFKGRAIQEMVQQCDKDGNGVIDYAQFRDCMFRKFD